MTMSDINSRQSGDRVLFDARWRGSHGIGRFAEQISQRIPGLVPLEPVLPLFHLLDPLWSSWLASSRHARAYFTPGFNPPLWSRLPLIITVYDLNYVHCSINSDPFRRAYFTHLVRPACRRAYRVLTISEYSRREIVEWGGLEASRVVNVGVGVESRFEPRGHQYSLGFPYLLAIGNERPHKNIGRLISAFAVSGLASHMKLVISGKLGDDARRALDETGVGAAVHPIGFVPDDDLPALYRGAQALCMPSLFEGFGLPVIEAMACGTPVLTSTATSLPEAAGDAAILVDPLDIEAMADGLRRIVGEQDTRATLIARGFLRSQEHSWDLTAQRIRAVLDGLD
jgi:glycosyltransferase involved in cell wall biosynthesis